MTSYGAIGAIGAMKAISLKVGLSDCHSGTGIAKDMKYTIT